MMGRIYLGRTARRRIGRSVAFVVLIGVAALFTAPFLFMIVSSLKSRAQLYGGGPIWVPIPAVWRNYIDAFLFLPFDLFFRNTMIVCVLTVLGTLISSSMVAYAFARIRFPGRDILFIVLISKMMMPWAVRIIPVYLMWKRFGLTNTLVPLFAPYWLGGALYVFLLRQFFRTIPEELSDAARIDGCSEIGIWLRIIMPLSGPALSVIGIFSFLSEWNDFIRPLIYVNETEKFTMALGLRMFMQMQGGNWSHLMAAAVSMSLPAILLFAFTQRYMVQGVTLTGMKG